MLEQKMGFRNLVRNKLRSLVTASIIVSTFSLMIVFLGLSDGGHEAMINIGIKMGVGHIVVYNKEYQKNPTLDNLIKEPSKVEDLLALNLGKEVKIVPRLRLDALVQSGSNGVAITLNGVVPELEKEVSNIANDAAIKEGLPLYKSLSNTLNITSRPAVIGKELAGMLDVSVGDRITVTTKPKDRVDFSREGFRVVGIFETGIHEVDSFWLETDMASAQNLANTGDSVTSLSVYLPFASQTNSVFDKLVKIPEFAFYDVRRWDQEAAQLYAAITLDAAGMYLLMVIIYVVVAVGVLNTILISVLKRKREFGVLLALGARPWAVVRIVFWEAIFLSVACIGLGLMIGCYGHYYFSTEGLNFKEVFGTTMQAGGVVLPDRFYSSLNYTKVIFSVVFVFLLTLVVTVYPAFKSSRLSPIDATR